MQDGGLVVVQVHQTLGSVEGHAQPPLPRQPGCQGRIRGGLQIIDTQRSSGQEASIVGECCIGSKSMFLGVLQTQRLHFWSGFNAQYSVTFLPSMRNRRCHVSLAARDASEVACKSHVKTPGDRGGGLSARKFQKHTE